MGVATLRFTLHDFDYLQAFGSRCMIVHMYVLI